MIPSACEDRCELREHEYRLRCESMTPFARPVVPPVYMSVARSSSPVRVMPPAGADSSSAKSTPR
ncbi:MAG TPA: hypothetical protein VEH31_20845, partial [Streptosporangiaceae bacterium]|nr:hypothetical protein [Streptosporangiaceae bacterium]